MGWRSEAARKDPKPQAWAMEGDYRNLLRKPQLQGQGEEVSSEALSST
jgi:hypothetical protein